MRDLQELGLPLTFADAQDFRGLWRPPIRGTDLHTRRLTGSEAAAIIDSRMWQALRLDGQLTEDVAKALSNQNALRALILTPTNGSEPLACAEQMPKLERVTFVDADLPEELVQPLGRCRTPQTVVFEDCSSSKVRGGPAGVLPAHVATRQVSRMVW